MNIALRVILMACILVTVLPPPARASVRETLNFNYYPVTAGPGRLGHAMSQAFRREKPGAPDASGWTETRLEWHYRIVGVGNGLCHLSSVDTKLSIFMILPRLVNSPSVQAEFDAYLPKLRIHENGHADIGRSKAREVDRALTTLGNDSCNTISTDADNRGKAILKKRHADDVAYDKRTGHGRTQGAWLQE